ncbi:peptidylprolyl isomerase [Ideonella sp. A 288]|uniref:peptidylprolyl isomerase n=1 Tax=Ideonella sp. A 288 TaxID=1962181 RepID=UPI0018FE9B92|nr:peptidylprolyl isomerase [Ideonella sp. A 288]
MSNRPLWPAAATLAMALTACGGGGGGGSAAVTNVSATGVAYSRTLTVTVNGAGLLVGGLTMTVEGPCGAVTKAANGTDLLAQFTCKVEGTGLLVPRIHDASGTELASMRLTVPLPQVLVAVKQGDRSGTFTLELDPVAAPISTKNFIDYVAAGFYANTIFHRVEAGSRVEGGGYTAGPAAKVELFSPIAVESANGLKNLRATIGVARGDASDTSTSQFYINLADNPQFDRVSDAQPGRAVFGKVVAGMDIVDEIGKVETAASGGFPKLPVSDVTITLAQQSK